jgi:hypothetical protein
LYNTGVKSITSSVADPDPVSGAFLPKGSGSGIFFPDLGSRILTMSQIQYLYIFKILPLKMAKNRKNSILFEI